jgi:hypothetical protein
MSIQTAIRLFSLPLIVGTIGILAASASGLSGFLALLIGCIIGFVLTELFYVPNTLKQWERTGAPGDPKTPEQQKLWEQEKFRLGKKRNLSILAGVIGWALLKNYTSPIPNGALVSQQWLSSRQDCVAAPHLLIGYPPA